MGSTRLGGVGRGVYQGRWGGQGGSTRVGWVGRVYQGRWGGQGRWVGYWVTGWLVRDDTLQLRGWAVDSAGLMQGLRLGAG